MGKQYAGSPRLFSVEVCSGMVSFQSFFMGKDTGYLCLF